MKAIARETLASGAWAQPGADIPALMGYPNFDPDRDCWDCPRCAHRNPPWDGECGNCYLHKRCRNRPYACAIGFW